METQATIVSIVYKPEGIESTPPDNYARVPLESANLIVGGGIEGDRKASNPKRQLNIMSAEMLEQLKTEGYKTGPGQLGEQIIVRGVDMNTLPAGTQVQLGDSVIEVISQRQGCDRFEHIQGHPKALTAGRIGAIAKVVTAGAIRVGDAVQVLETVNE